MGTVKTIVMTTPPAHGNKDHENDDATTIMMVAVSTMTHIPQACQLTNYTDTTLNQVLKLHWRSHQKTTTPVCEPTPICPDAEAQN